VTRKKRTRQHGIDGAKQRNQAQSNATV